MGIKALDLAEWIEVDERFAAQLAERRRLLDERPADVLAGCRKARGVSRSCCSSCSIICLRASPSTTVGATG